MPKYKIEYVSYFRDFSTGDVDEEDKVVVEETEDFSCPALALHKYTPEVWEWEYSHRDGGVGCLICDGPHKFRQYYLATPIEEKSSGQKHYESWIKQLIYPKVPAWDELDEKVRKTWDLANEENKDSVS